MPSQGQSFSWWCCLGQPCSSQRASRGNQAALLGSWSWSGGSRRGGAPQGHRAWLSVPPRGGDAPQHTQRQSWRESGTADSEMAARSRPVPPRSHPPLSCCVFSQRCLVNVESGIKQVCSFQLSLSLDLCSLPLLPSFPPPPSLSLLPSPSPSP